MTICMRESESSWYFDTVTLANFALTGSFGLVTERYGRSLLVTEAVRTELAAGRTKGYSALEVVESALGSRHIASAGPMGWDESALFAELLQSLGSGEASCIAFARHRSGIVATDDRAARLCCSQYDVRVTGTIGILKAMCLDRTFSPDAADQ
jgi:predicted nucleic acid-binding protein